jgi:Ni2+-binding GTPase involved in maturation of urease and hydrogenase
VPCSPSFTLEDEVKSVITVLAKTHHYWRAHGGTVRPSRPLKIGVGGPRGSGKSTLIAALSAHLRGRFVTGVERIAPDQDLVLFERTELDANMAFSPSDVDATIGVVRLAGGNRVGDARAALSASWHLLVVNAQASMSTVHREWLETQVRQFRGDRPIVFADPRTGDGLESVVAWLEHDLLLGL